jgi:hypothetical protein
MKVSLVCRVCGIDFTAPRFDARTCSSTCRSRLRRGGDLAYLSGLSKREQRKAREIHAAYDKAKAAHRKYVVAAREAREASRKVREREAEEKHQLLLDQIVGAAYRKVTSAASN